MVSVHCVNLLEYVTKRRASYFDTGFVSEMRLTTLSLIHYFVAFRILATSLCILETSAPDAAVLPPDNYFLVSLGTIKRYKTFRLFNFNHCPRLPKGFVTSSLQLHIDIDYEI